jgi:sec-independent protein translocase protein TatB
MVAMFDITSSKLFLLAIVALLVIGPKDFPILLRTIGKYMGIIRGHAREFRAQFDEAMRDSELTQLKQDMEKMARETEASLNNTSQSVPQTFDEARQSVEKSVESSVTDPLAPASAEPAPGAQLGEPAAPQSADAGAPADADAPAEAPISAEPPPVAPAAGDAPAPAAAAQTAPPGPATQPAVERTGA